MPTVINNVAYVLDTTQDPGFVCIHRGFLGDANDNGIVNFDDFLTLSQNFGQPGGWSQANFLGDPTVDFNDFLVLSQHFGESILPGSSAARADKLAAFQSASARFFAGNGVPEPASLMLLGLGTLVLLARRRRGYVIEHKTERRVMLVRGG